METLTLTLGDRRFVLAPGTQERQLEKRLLTAVRRGAGLLRLSLASGAEVVALVSPAVPVTLERNREERGGLYDDEPWWRSERQDDWSDSELERAL
jgi:hypothetical protein